MAAQRCYVPSCDDDKGGGDSGGIYQNWTDFALPKEYTAKAIFTDGQPFHPCKKYKEVESGEGGCRRENFDNETSEALE